MPSSAAHRGFLARPREDWRSSFANQVTELRTDGGPIRTSPTLPGPVASEPLPMPANHRLRPDHQQRMPPTRPQPRQQNPKHSVHSAQPRSLLARLPHGELLPKRQVLQRQVAVPANACSQRPTDDPEPSHHDRPIVEHSANRKKIVRHEFSEGTARCPDHPIEIARDKTSVPTIRAMAAPKVERR
jgi:hypothetical protein